MRDDGSDLKNMSPPVLRSLNILKTLIGTSALLAVTQTGLTCSAIATTTNTLNLYVSAAGTNSGSGTAADPFVLTAGREYDFNRMIRPYLDDGTPVRVLFNDGIYSNVRMQILRQGIDTTTIYMTHSSATAGGAPTTYHTGAWCNAAGENCRIKAADFTMGANTTTPLELDALHYGSAIFDGTGTRDVKPAIDSVALTISGSIFGAPPNSPYNILSQRISNVKVQGLVFRNYRNGVDLRFASDIVIQSCTITQIGHRIARQSAAEPFGTYGISIDADTRLALFRLNTITDIWNVGTDGTYAAAAGDPGLIHALYSGYSKDAIFESNLFDGSSGPMIKWGYYPQVTGAVVYEYPSAPSDRRNFFIGNSFTLDTAHDGPSPNTANAPGQAFIHDNSRVVIGSTESKPAAGEVFLSNQFINTLPTDSGPPDLLVRQEIPLTADTLDLPGWSFHGNTVTGISSNLLVVGRLRGLMTAAVAAAFASEGQQYIRYFDLTTQSSTGQRVAANWAVAMTSLLQTSLASDDPVEDANVLWVAKYGELHGVN